MGWLIPPHHKGVIFLDLKEILMLHTFNITTVNELKEFWKRALVARCCRLFKWEGLPFSQTALELICILNGFGVCIRKNNTIFPAFCTPSSWNSYNILDFDSVNYTTGQISGYTTIDNTTAILFKNDSIKLGLSEFIESYAIMLAHVDNTIQNVCINAREPNGVPICARDNEKDGVIAYRNSLANGEYTPIQDKTLSMIEWVLQKEKSVDVRQFMDLRSELLKSFYEDVGIRSVRYKRANMTSQEFEFDLPRLRLNVDDFLDCRREFASQLAKWTENDISVDFSPAVNFTLENGGEIFANNEFS